MKKALPIALAALCALLALAGLLQAAGLFSIQPAEVISLSALGGIRVRPEERKAEGAIPINTASLEDLMTLRPTETMQRYKIKNADAKGYELLEEVCRGRGFLMRGGVLDMDRACSVVLDEFRAGKVGKLTLETAPKEEKPHAPETV